MPSAFCLLHSAFPLVPLLLLWLALGLVGWGAGAQVPGILNNQGRLAINGTSFTGLAGRTRLAQIVLVANNSGTVYGMLLGFYQQAAPGGGPNLRMLMGMGT